MAEFNPPELEEQVKRALEIWAENIDELHIDEDETLITLDTRITVFLPECEEFKIACRDFLDYMSEIKTAKITENTLCTTGKRFLMRIEPYRQRHINIYTTPFVMPKTKMKLLFGSSSRKHRNWSIY